MSNANTFGTIGSKKVNTVSIEKVVPQSNSKNPNLDFIKGRPPVDSLAAKMKIIPEGQTEADHVSKDIESKNTVDLTFGSTKIGQEPPQHILMLLKKLNIPFSIDKNYIQHTPNETFFTVFEPGSNRKIMIDLKNQDIVTSFDSSQFTKFFENKSISNSELKDDEEIKNPFANIVEGFSPDNLKKIYGEQEGVSNGEEKTVKTIEDRIKEIDAEFRSIMTKSDDASKLRRLELTREKTKLTREKNKIKEIDTEDQKIEKDWSFGKKFIEGKKEPVSSDDAIRQEYQELSNKVSAEGYTEQEREAFLEKGIAIEKVLTNLKQEKIASPVVTLENKIGNTTGLIDLFKVIEQSNGIRRGEDFFTPGEIRERIVKFLQSNGDIRDIPETDGLRKKVLEIKKNREQENMLLEMDGASELKSDNVIPVALEQGLESVTVKNVLPDDVFLDEPVLIAQEQNKKRLEQEALELQKQDQQRIKMEMLKNNLNAARAEYAKQQGEYNKRSYIDRFSAKVANIFGNNSEVTREKFNAQNAYESAKQAYLQEMAQQKKPVTEIIGFIQQEQVTFAESMPLKRRQQLARFAGKLGMGALSTVATTVGTVANSYTQATESALKTIGLSEASAKTASKWIGRGLLATTFGLVSGGGGIVATAGNVAVRMAGAELADWAVLKRVFGNDTEAKVLEKTVEKFAETDLTNAKNLATLERKVKNAKKTSTLNRFMRGALKIGAGMGTGAAVNAIDAAYFTPQVEVPQTPNDMQIGKIEEDIGIRPEATPGTGVENLSSDALVRTGEGVTHPILRQLQADPELAKAFGVEGTPTGADAARVAKEFGYIDTNGTEIRVFDGNNAAYELKIDSNGNPVINEYKNGIFMESKSIGSAFEGSGAEPYEYIENKTPITSFNAGSANNFPEQFDQPAPGYQPEATTTLEKIQSNIVGGGISIPQSLNPFIDGSAPFDPSNIALNKILLTEAYPNATSDQLIKMAEGVKNLYAQGVTTPPDQLFNQAQSVKVTPDTLFN